MVTMNELDLLLKKQFPAIDFDEGHLVEHRVLDSLALFELIGILESKYELSIPMEEITPENFDSKQAILSLINKLSQSK